MVIVKLTSPVSSEFECEVIDAGLKQIKSRLELVRPCERYWEMFKSCKSIKGRLHQYYVYGELFDCNTHKNNYNSCVNYRKTKNLDELDPIISWESDLINIRMKSAERNDTWEFRKEPPEDFNGPLPEFIAKRQSDSMFSKHLGPTRTK